jgi:uncharacterized membrane protein YeaQ/YmgE (transglycosylase-associated protein family)
LFSFYFNIGLIYLLVGFAVALISYFVFKKMVLGNFLGALVIALIGSYLGGVLEFVFKDVINFLTNLNNSVNVFPPFITSIILMWIYTKVSEKYK